MLMRMRTKLSLIALGSFVAAICVLTPLILLYLESHGGAVQQTAESYMTAQSTGGGFGGITFRDLGILVGVMGGFAGFFYYIIKS